MDAVEVIARCRALGAVLVVDGDALRVRAPAPLPDYLRESLRTNKTQLVLVLKVCQRSTCSNPLTPHSAHELPWECDPDSCYCWRTFLYPRICQGAPCRWVWPDGVPDLEPKS